MIFVPLGNTFKYPSKIWLSWLLWHVKRLTTFNYCIRYKKRECRMGSSAVKISA
uniref:Uncharacterized protein n=1 Tax=Rhizophora mucronata TaxID=61149 RepID=A0A2P2LZ85_RHIMU